MGTENGWYKDNTKTETEHDVPKKPMLKFDYASLYFNTIPLCSYYTNNKNEITL